MPVDYNLQARIAYLSWLNAEENEEQLFVRTLRDYAEGEHPTFLTERQEQFLGLKAQDANYRYAHNLCGLIIQSLVERLSVTGFAATIQGADDETHISLCELWWDANLMDTQEDLIYEATLRDGQGFLIVDWDAQRMVPRWTWNERFDGTQGVRLYRDPNSNAVLFAAKRWQVYNPIDTKDNGRTRVTLYFPDRVEKLISAIGSNAGIAGMGWEPYLDDGDTDGIVPWTDGTGQPLGCAAVPFDNPGGSEIAQVLSMQDMLNKSDLDLVAAADMAGFRILYATGATSAIGADGLPEEVTIAPGRLITLPDPQARLGAIEPVDPNLLIANSRYWMVAMAGVSRTPQYLLQPAGADQPSGESLRMQEVGLVHKAERRQKAFGDSWASVLQLSARLHNLNRPAEGVTVAPVEIEWADAEAQEQPDVIEARNAATLQALVAAGVPLEIAAGRAGWTEDEVVALQESLIAQQAANKLSLGQALAQAQRAFDQGQGANIATSQTPVARGGNGQQPAGTD